MNLLFNELKLLFKPKSKVNVGAMITDRYERKIEELELLLESQHKYLNGLIDWLGSNKYGYFLEDHKTWVNYGDLNDKFPYDEKDKQWELSRNRMIDKTISKIEALMKE